MKMLNELEAACKKDTNILGSALPEGISILLRVLYPMVPHIAYSLWQELGFATAQGDLLDTAWPVVDEAALARDDVEYVVQVNGKLRDHLTAPATADNAALQEMALALENVKRFTDGLTVRKCVVVPKKLINIVVS